MHMPMSDEERKVIEERIAMDWVRRQMANETANRPLPQERNVDFSKGIVWFASILFGIVIISSIAALFLGIDFPAELLREAKWICGIAWGTTNAGYIIKCCFEGQGKN